MNLHVFYEPTLAEVAVGAAINKLINEPPIFFIANEAREFVKMLLDCLALPKPDVPVFLGDVIKILAIRKMRFSI